jgi:hypothetical protein
MTRLPMFLARALAVAAATALFGPAVYAAGQTNGNAAAQTNGNGANGTAPARTPSRAWR